MNYFRIALASATLALGVASAAAADVYSFTVNQVIPDGQPAGFSDTHAIVSGISQIGSVQVGLNIVGNYNGDIYCYLQHGSALSVLLNRTGRTAGNSFGYDDGGFNIALSDSAVNGNIHTYRNVTVPPGNGVLTGVWQPDGRYVNPATVLDTDLVTAPLSVFNGMDPNGTWTLFVADMSSGGVSVLNGWQLTITQIPEPTILTFTALGLGAVLLARRRNR
jgi:subtilisin-like proprotein convertase family protein